MSRISKIVMTALLIAVGLALGWVAPAWADNEIKIGLVYPLTGTAASTGLELKQAAELAADIINSGTPKFDLPLSGSAGLPNLKGAKLKLIFADHQGNPQVGASETERLITQEKVVAIVGCYFSSVTATASQVAERYGIPFLNPESTSSTLTTRGFKWFFRTTPHDELFVRNFFEFLKDLDAKKSIKVNKLAVLNENTLWGSESLKLEEQLAQDQGYTIAEKILYPAKATQMDSEVEKLKAANPQVLLQSSYLGDALLSMKTYKELGFNPDAILANDAGFNDTEFLKTMGKDGEFILSREVWALDLTTQKPLVKAVNDLYNQRYKINFTGNSARTFTGVMTLADAINRAGSTDPAAIQAALKKTDIPGSQIIMPWKGIKFDDSGQNTLGAGIMVQVQGGEYHTVWPFDLASKPIIWPMPKWSQR